MATNFDRFLAGLLNQGVQQVPGMQRQIQQASQGLPPDLVQQITQMAAGDAVQGINRFNQPAPAPQAPLDMSPYIQATGGDPRRMASTTPTAAPVQGPVPNPNTEYRPTSESQELAPEPVLQTPTTGKRTQDLVPSGTPLTDDESYVAVEIQVPGPNESMQPLRIMVPEHYLANGAPEGVTVFGGGQTTPASQIPDEYKLENQDESVRWMFTDERDTDAATQRDSVPTPTFINDQGVAYAGPEYEEAQKTPDEIEAEAAASETYSVDDLADQNLANTLRAQGITTIQGDQYPLTDPDTGQVRLATQQEIIDEDLPVPVEWLYEDDAFVTQLHDAGITSMRLSQMPVMENGAIRLENRPIPENEPSPKITPQEVAKSDPAIANEMISAGIEEIPDGMALVREGGRLAIRNQDEVDPDDVIYYGGQTQPVASGGLMDVVGGVIGAIPGAAKVMEIGDKPRQWNTGRAGDSIYEEVTEWDRLAAVAEGSDVGPAERPSSPPGTVQYPQTPDGNTATLDMFRQWGWDNPEIVKQLHEQGYDVDGDGQSDFTGGQAVWEYWIGQQPAAVRALFDLAYDPTVLLPAGAGVAKNIGRGVLGNAVRNSLPREALGRGVYGIGKALEFIDEAPGRALMAPVRAVTRTPVVADSLQRSAITAADRVQASRVLPDADTRLAGVDRSGIVPEGTVLERGDYTGPVGKLLNPSEQSRMAEALEPYTKIADNALHEANANAQRIARTIDEVPPETPGGQVADATSGPGAEPTVQQPELQLGQATVPDEATIQAMPEEQRVREIEQADALAPSEPTTVITDATDLPLRESTAPQQGLGVPVEEGTNLPRPTSREWGVYAPQDGGDYLTSRLYATREQYPNRWRSFHDDVNDTIREYVERRKTANQLGKARREALERERQERVRSGNARPGDEQPVRLYDEAAMQTVDEMDVLLDIYRAAQRNYGDIADIHHTFSEQFRRDMTRTGKDRRFYGQTDSYFIERAVFGTPRQSALALGQLRYRALDLGDEVLGREIPRIQRMRRDWEAIQREPRNRPVATSAGNAEFEMGVAPVEDIKTTRGMTPEQMRDAGLPVQDFQNRTQDFAEETVRDMVNNYQGASMRPIQVVRGTDGSLYVLDGHSRLEAFKRLNRDEIPYQVVTGTEGEIARAADIANVSGTANTPIDQGRVAQRRIDAGETPNDVASAMKIKRRELDQRLSVRHIDPESQLGQDLNAGRVDVAVAAPIGKAVGDGKLTMTEADAFYRNVVVNNDLSARAVADEVSDLYKFKVNEGDGDTLFDLSTVESDRFWQARSQAAAVRKEIASLRRQRTQYNAIEKRDGLSRAQKKSRREIDQRIQDLQNDAVAADELARDAFYGVPDTPVEEPLLRPMTEEDAQAIQDVEPDVEDVAPDPAQQMRDSGADTLFSAPPGVPQLSRALTDPETGGWRRVKNLNAGDALNEEGRRTAKLVEIDEALSDRRKDFLATDYQVVLTGDEVSTLSKRVGPDAESPTAMQLWEQYRKEAEENGATSLEALETGATRMLQDLYADAMRRYSPKKYDRYLAEYHDIMAKHPKADPYQTHIAAAKAANERTSIVPGGYDTYLRVQREIRLYNPITGSRYVMTQAVGNTITAMLGAGLVRGKTITSDIFNRKNWESARADLRGEKNLSDLYATPDSPDDIRRIALEAEAETPGITLDQADHMMLQSGLISNETVLSIPREEGMGLRATKELAEDTMTQRWMERYRWTKPFAKKWNVKGPIKGASDLLASAEVREMANAFDLSARKATFAERFRTNLAGVRDPFYEHAKAALPEGADAARFDAIWDELPEVFSDADLRTVLQEIDAGYAERIGRDWRATLRSAEKDANSEVNRLFFSGQERNADAILRRVIMFHYWMSRATPLYTASLMKHVGLMTNYFKMMESLQEQSENYGAPVKGMMKIFNSVFGYNVFIRPDGLMQTILALEPNDSFDPEGESGLFSFLRNSGLMFNPMILSAGNFLGLAGDTFAPDPFSLQTHAAFTTTAIDFVKSILPGADRPTRNRYQEFNDWVRSQTSKVTGREIPFQRSDQYAMIEINNLIYDIAEERGLDWDDPDDQMQIVASMNDPESELYQAAFNRYARMSGAQIVSRILPTSILYPKFRQSGKDERSLTIRETERSDPANERARDQRGRAAITDPQVIALRQQQDEYQQTGTDEQREAYSTYNAIRFGPLDVPIVYNGVTISERQLRTMDTDQRTTVADTWAEQTGVADDVAFVRDERKAYRESHPDYAAYYDWSMTVRDHDGGAVGFWQELIKVNPNAARWYESLDETRSGDLDQRLTSVDAYLAAEGLRASGYDKDPLSTGGVSPTAMSLMGGGGTRYGIGQSSDPAQRIADDIAEYQQASAQVDQQIQAIYGPNASLAAIENSNPMARAGYLDRLKREGIEVPTLSAESRRYIEWAQAQEPGSDTSINAYITWKEQYDMAPATEPEGSGDMQLEELLRLLG